MAIKNRLRLSHDKTTGRVHLQLRNRPPSENGNRRTVVSSLQWVQRTDLRELCDMLHDYADHLDAQDRARGGHQHHTAVTNSPGTQGHAHHR